LGRERHPAGWTVQSGRTEATQRPVLVKG
jgi:hypothetical protein